jgi:hypothetical protein
MTGRPSVFAGHVGAIVVGTLIGTLIASAAATIVQSDDEVTAPPPTIAGSLPTSPTVVSPGAGEETLLLAWASGGLPKRAERVLEALPYVTRATTVQSGIDWVRHPSPELQDGAIPIEVALVKPREYAFFVAPVERTTILDLDQGEALLAESAVDLNQIAGDGSLRLVDRTLRVRATVDDVSASGYEALIAGTPPASWSRVDRFLLVHLRDQSKRQLVEAKLRTILGPGQALRVRAKGETPFLRYGDAVLPQLLIKRTFGQFAARPNPDGTLEIDPEWTRRNIRTASVPVLGRVTCHRALIPQLAAALGELEREGLAHTVDTGEYGGCFGPRFIGLEPRGRLSHHAWGIAIDINVAANAFGTKSDQDPRLVQIMERHGFTWGGRWLVPDAMHFEWVEFP